MTNEQNEVTCESVEEANAKWYGHALNAAALMQEAESLIINLAETLGDDSHIVRSVSYKLSKEYTAILELIEKDNSKQTHLHEGSY